MSTIALVASETDTGSPHAIRQAAADLAADFWHEPTPEQLSAIEHALAIYGDEPETVGQYNTTHAGKAWAVIGVTFEMVTFCADCVHDDPLAVWFPIFASDDYDGTACDHCRKVL
jgi:hypothetical protein